MTLPLPAPGRVNATPLADNHPSDHDVIVDSVNELWADLNDALDAARYRTYDTVADRDADTGAHVEGTLAWATSERVLAIWHGEWQVLTQPFTPFVPRCFFGDTEMRALGPPPPYQTGYRLSYGVVEFSIGHRFGQIADPPLMDPTDILMVLPPVPPDGQGGFGTAYVVDVTGVGAVGGMGGVYNPTQLSIVVPGFGGLLRRSDLGPAGGNIDVFMNGTYTTATFAL
jgi:hypothetical protein